MSFVQNSSCFGVDGSGDIILGMGDRWGVGGVKVSSGGEEGESLPRISLRLFLRGVRGHLGLGR